MIKHRFAFFASCPLGLENLLAQEIEHLGAKSVSLSRGGVTIDCYNEVAIKVLLHSRIASRVFRLLYTFEEIKNEKDLYLKASDIKWKSLLEKNDTFKIHTAFGALPKERDEFRNTNFTSLKLKDAIVDWFRHYEGSRPSVNKDLPDHAFLLRVEKSPSNYRAKIYHDLSGHALHERGYRVAQTPAPIKENLAAGILGLLNWIPEKEHFHDGMCGSGTFLIEAALIAGKISPSYLKAQRLQSAPNSLLWTFQNSPWFKKDKHLQENFKSEISLTLNGLEDKLNHLKNIQLISGGDKDEKVIGYAKDNLKKAKLDFINLDIQDAREIPISPDPTLYLFNPPYGERLESKEQEQLNDLYFEMGEHWKKTFTGSRVAMFSGNFEAIKKIHLRSKKIANLKNGPIDCQLKEYALY